jgi:hypothetical protein
MKCDGPSCPRQIDTEEPATDYIEITRPDENQVLVFCSKKCMGAFDIQHDYPFNWASSQVDWDITKQQDGWKLTINGDTYTFDHAKTEGLPTGKAGLYDNTDSPKRILNMQSPAYPNRLLDVLARCS